MKNKKKIIIINRNEIDVFTFLFIFFMQIYFWNGATFFSEIEGENFVGFICWFLALGLLLLNFIIRRTIPLVPLLLAFGVVVIAAYGVRYSGADVILRIAVFLFGLRDINAKKAIKYYTISNILILVFVSASSWLGVIENKEFLKLGKVVYTFGFINPNIVAILATVCILGYFYTHYDNLKFAQYCIGLLCMIGIYKINGSRSSLITLSIMLIFVAFDKTLNFMNAFFKFKQLQVILYLLFPFLFFFSYYIANNYNNNIIIQELNLLFSWRFYFWNYYARKFGITPFGTAYDALNIGSLDNGFLVLLYRCGAVAVILYFIIFMYAIHYALMRKDRMGLIMIICYFPFMFVEGYPIFSGVCLVIIYFCCAWWDRNNKKVDIEQIYDYKRRSMFL